MFHVDKSTEAEAAEFGKFLKAKATLLSHSADVNPKKKKLRVWRIATRGHTSRSAVVNSQHHEQLCIISLTASPGATRPCWASRKLALSDGVKIWGE